MYTLCNGKCELVICFSCYFTVIPHWLTVYSRASQDLDHKLRWEMFRLPELDCFNAMLTRLYKQELEEIVMRYEAYRYVCAHALCMCTFYSVEFILKESLISD